MTYLEFLQEYGPVAYQLFTKTPVTEKDSNQRRIVISKDENNKSSLTLTALNLRHGVPYGSTTSITEHYSGAANVVWAQVTLTANPQLENPFTLTIEKLNPPMKKIARITFTPNFVIRSVVAPTLLEVPKQGGNYPYWFESIRVAPTSTKEILQKWAQGKPVLKVY